MSPERRTALYKKLPCRLLVYLLAALILAMPLRTALEQHFIYFPDPQQEVTPGFLGLPFEEVNFTSSDDTRLNGWLVPGEEDAPVILFCMGNAGNISHRLDTLRLLHELGVTVFIFNYRGYGQSEGRADEAGTYLDAAAAVTFLQSRGWSAQQMILFGRSLGAAISLEAALRTQPAGLIMESPFTSITAMGKHHYPLLNLLLGWLIGAKYDNLDKIASLQSPLLIIHGKLDETCPPEMAETLFAEAPQDKQLLWIPHGEHNNNLYIGGETYRRAIAEAIEHWTGYN